MSPPSRRASAKASSALNQIKTRGNAPRFLTGLTRSVILFKPHEQGRQSSLVDEPVSARLGRGGAPRDVCDYQDRRKAVQSAERRRHFRREAQRRRGRDRQVRRAHDEVKVGTPVVEGANVTGKVLAHGKQAKIMVFKYKSKKNYRRSAGHRQPFTKVEITIG